MKSTIEQKQQAAGLVANAHDLISEGMFPGKFAETSVKVQKFLRELHEDMIKDLEKEENEEPKIESEVEAGS